MKPLVILLDLLAGDERCLHIIAAPKLALTCDISTRDGCNFQSYTTRPLLSYFHPLVLFFLTLTPLLTLPTLVTFSEFLLSTTYYSLLPLSVFSLSFPHLLPFCPFHPVCSYIYVSLYCYLSLVVSFVLKFQCFFCLLIHHLSSPLLNLSTCSFLGLLLAMPRIWFYLFTSLSYYMHCLHMLSLSLCISLSSAAFFLQTADKPADKGEREHI